MKRILYLLFAVMFMACSEKEDVTTYKDSLGNYTGTYELWIGGEYKETGNFSFEITGNKNELLFEWAEKDISFPVAFIDKGSGSWELVSALNGYSFRYLSHTYEATMSASVGDTHFHDYFFTLDQ